jgi:hypothetical protein
MRFSADIAGSGLRSGDANITTVAPYAQVNVGVAREFLLPDDPKPMILRFDVVNLFDTISDQERKRHRRARSAIRTAPRLFPRNIEKVLKSQPIIHLRLMESEMAVIKIGRALFIAYSIVSCVLLARVNVAHADLRNEQTIGDGAHRTVRSSNSKDDLAKGGGFLHVYPPSEHKDELRRKKKFRSRSVTEATRCG